MDLSYPISYTLLAIQCTRFKVEYIYIIQLIAFNQKSLNNVQTLLLKDVEIIKVGNISSEVVTLSLPTLIILEA